MNESFLSTKECILQPLDVSNYFFFLNCEKREGGGKQCISHIEGLHFSLKGFWNPYSCY